MDPVETAALVIITLAGLAVGSWLNIVIRRVPGREPVMSPLVRCPACEAQIADGEPIPVLAWLLLRDRCRSCGAPLRPRFLAVGLLTGALFAGMALVLGVTWELPAYLYLTTVSVALVVIDLDTRRLPDALTLPSYPILAGLLLIPALLDGRWDDYGRAMLGAAALFACYLVLALVYPAGMGMGDVKLSGVLGMGMAWFGWGQWLVGALLAFLLGAVVGLGLMLLGRASRRSALPFGPSMVVAAFLGVLAGPEIGAWYAGLLTG